MEFIFSPFLWLLPLATIPLIFHLINNRKFRTVDYSSIQFINYLKTKSMKKMNIINILLLLIRMLIIAFLILSISRPVITSSKTEAFNDSSSISLVVIIDDTFSNMNEYIYLSQIEKIKNQTSIILDNYNKDVHLEVLSINKKLLFKGLVRDFDFDSIPINSSYKMGNISDLLIEYFAY